MPSTLVFPDGVRLAGEDELPGPEPRRSADWARIQSASIAAGFVLTRSDDERFTHYAELNVDAPRLWALFCNLCCDVLGPAATLVIGHIDEEPVPIGAARVSSVLAILEPHKYQLAHDGLLQFGLVSTGDSTINEVFVAPTKHVKIWLNDQERFRSVMEQHELRQVDRLEFLDEYPRATVALPIDKVAFHDVGELLTHLENEIAAMSDGGTT